MNLLKMCGPQIRLCLFTFRPIASKRLNILDYIDIIIAQQSILSDDSVVLR